MKRLKCPQCEEFIIFDENEDTTPFEETGLFSDMYDPEFKVIKVRLKPKRDDLGEVVVVENVFCEKQIFPLKLGDNLFGRKCNGTIVDAAIDTGDMSMDRRHCIFNVSEKDGNLVYTVRDNESLCGTFVMNEILQKNEKRIIEDSEIITIGATTLILKTKK